MFSRIEPAVPEVARRIRSLLATVPRGSGYTLNVEPALRAIPRRGKEGWREGGTAAASKGAADEETLKNTSVPVYSPVVEIASQDLQGGLAACVTRALKFSAVLVSIRQGPYLRSALNPSGGRHPGLQQNGTNGCTNHFQDGLCLQIVLSPGSAWSRLF
jgi:hypothetical protein